MYCDNRYIWVCLGQSRHMVTQAVSLSSQVLSQGLLGQMFSLNKTKPFAISWTSPTAFSQRWSQNYLSGRNISAKHVYQNSTRCPLPISRCPFMRTRPHVFIQKELPAVNARSTAPPKALSCLSLDYGCPWTCQHLHMCVRFSKAWSASDLTLELSITCGR